MELPVGKLLGVLRQLRMQVLLVQFMLLVSPATLQHQQHLFYHPRQLYGDAPRLRRFEYATPLVGGYSPVAAAPPPIHFQQQTPHFQLVNYRPTYQPLALEYQQQQLPAPAPPLPPLYPQQSVQYQQRTIAPHAELAKYRYEGNYLPVQRVSLPHPQPQRRAEEQQQLQQQHLQEQQQQQQQQLYNVPPALFTSDVLHVIPPRIARLQEQQQQPSQNVQTERPRRFAKDLDTDVAETKETKYFHDIFMRFDGPTSRSHGHVLKHPRAQEKRFESQRGTNRYKGEVIWTDRQGGRGEHRWDLAQGKL
ncbi:putative mediator of RNA polymerase II transcription subunit 26 [Drosophila biarmipes]|uniref:putative mediator of RNA polymerase II transcription subunit 26 n=1 Tax=Drosophila biarmipes TaxID=125945 RepID=UPI0007E843B9|nr:putative mediator of RNA polymerase II transcription subunit 26 [Drosophila biarmipes]